VASPGCFMTAIVANLGPPGPISVPLMRFSCVILGMGPKPGDREMDPSPIPLWVYSFILLTTSCRQETHHHYQQLPKHAHSTTKLRGSCHTTVEVPLVNFQWNREAWPLVRAWLPRGSGTHLSCPISAHSSSFFPVTFQIPPKKARSPDSLPVSPLPRSLGSSVYPHHPTTL
jgi:hypothetical protein